MYISADRSLNSLNHVFIHNTAVGCIVNNAVDGCLHDLSFSLARTSLMAVSSSTTKDVLHPFDADARWQPTSVLNHGTCATLGELDRSSQVATRNAQAASPLGLGASH